MESFWSCFATHTPAPFTVTMAPRKTSKKAATPNSEEIDELIDDEVDPTPPALLVTFNVGINPLSQPAATGSLVHRRGKEKQLAPTIRQLAAQDIDLIEHIPFLQSILKKHHMEDIYEIVEGKTPPLKYYFRGSGGGK